MNKNGLKPDKWPYALPRLQIVSLSAAFESKSFDEQFKMRTPM